MLKCKKCAHYYRTMVGEGGYNPAPCCHLWEDEGKRPNILSQECYKPRKRERRKETRKDV